MLSHPILGQSAAGGGNGTCRPLCPQEPPQHHPFCCPVKSCQEFLPINQPSHEQPTRWETTKAEAWVLGQWLPAVDGPRGTWCHQRRDIESLTLRSLNTPKSEPLNANRIFWWFKVRTLGLHRPGSESTFPFSAGASVDGFYLWLFPGLICFHCQMDFPVPTFITLWELRKIIL